VRRFPHRLSPWLLACAALTALVCAGCATAPPSPTLPPAPTATPRPTPTPTPIPPIPLTLHFPAAVSALEGVPIAADLPGLAQRDPGARVWVRVSDPRHHQYWSSDLLRGEGDTYTAPTLLYLPLFPQPGDWWLTVFVQTRETIRGERVLTFQPLSLPLRDLSGKVRSGVSLAIPQAFGEVQQSGDEVAGGRVWSRDEETVELWWAPGPAKPLHLDTASMFLEATLPPNTAVERLAVEPVEWNTARGFRFSERWPQGVAEALVVQGNDRWLYLLRLRAAGEGLSPLLRQIQATFRIE